MNRRELKYLFLISIMLVLCFPPFPLGILAPFAIALFMWFIKDYSTKGAFRLGYLLGLIWGSFTLFWIAASTVVGALLVITINALHYAIVWWLFTHLRKVKEWFALAALPFIWVAAEYLRLFGELRFNWMTLAYTQTYYLPFIQISEITGYLAVSFCLVAIAVFIYAMKLLAKKWRPVPIGIILILIIADGFYGNARIHEIESRKYHLIKAALVQPNVDPYEKWDPAFQEEAFNMLLSASRQILPRHPKLIIWPETATPFFLRANPRAIDSIAHLTDSAQVFLLTGTPDYQYSREDQANRAYNSAFFFRPGSKAFESYAKMALVPGSETIPFKRTFRFLRKIDVGGGDFFPGNDFKVFAFQIPEETGEFGRESFREVTSDSSKKVSVGLSAIICYESVFPHLVRRFVRRGANLLTIITNDGWFGLTSGPYQHAQYAVFRAIENRISIIRCANTGISGFIDPAGRYLQKAALNTRKDLVARVPIRTELTYYSRSGEWFGKLMLLISFGIIFIRIIHWLFYQRSKGKMNPE